MAQSEKTLSPERKEDLLTNDRSFKIYVIDKFEEPYNCVKLKQLDRLENNNKWIKRLVLGIYAAIILKIVGIF